MPNQLNATHGHSEASNHLTVTHDRTFNGKQLYYHEDGLILEYLADIDQVLTEALNQYPRIFAAHLTLDLPSDFRGDSPLGICPFLSNFRISFEHDGLYDINNMELI